MDKTDAKKLVNETDEHRPTDSSPHAPIAMMFQLVLLFFNLVLIFAILIVSLLWACVRELNDMDMIPAPGMDRSVCIAEEGTEEMCRKMAPETYLSELIDKDIRKNHMQYMGEKLNYANVVCRNHTPSVYKYKGLQRRRSISGTLIWNDDNQSGNSKQDSVEYKQSSGLFRILKSGHFFIYSQVTEKAENSENATVLEISLISNERTKTLLASSNEVCYMVNAVSKRTHYVGSAFYLTEGDLLFSTHSHPNRILDFDTFLGIRELGFRSSKESG